MKQKPVVSNFYCHNTMCVRYLKEDEIDLHKNVLNHDVEEMKPGESDKKDVSPD